MQSWYDTMLDMKLFINTGGKGERLKVLTENIPKPMLQFDGKPILEHLVIWARENGISDIVMLNGYLHEKIESYFEDGREFGIPISHSTEAEPLGSGGCVKKAIHLADTTFALISGDLLCRVDLGKMRASHAAAAGI